MAAAVAKCDAFLAPSPRSSDEFTIRMIDELIHKHSINRFGELDNSPESYQDKQKRIIETIKGCEVQIFNDPTIVYPIYRPHFSGKTATLSNILTGTFYYLYYHLIKNTAVEINVKADLYTLFHAGLLIDFSNLPLKDEIVIQKIIQILLQKAETQHIELFTPDWWDSLLPYIESIIKRLDRREMWRVFSEVFAPEEISIFNYGPYEDTVNYIDHDTREYDKLLTDPAKFEKYRIQIINMRRLFTPPDENMAALFEITGGGRHQAIKKMTRRRRKTKRARRSIQNGQKKDFRSRA